MLCAVCGVEPAALRRSLDRSVACKGCFISKFEEEIWELIVSENLFHPKERLGIGVSGGKDSAVLVTVLDKLNRKHEQGWVLELIAIDEGIAGYRDKSLDAATALATGTGLRLHCLSFKDLFGYTMDEIASLTGRRLNCSFCGVLRRQALHLATRQLGLRHLVTGHNADDLAETVLLNLFRGDASRWNQGGGVIARFPLYLAGSEEEPVQSARIFHEAARPRGAARALPSAEGLSEGMPLVAASAPPDSTTIVAEPALPDIATIVDNRDLPSTASSWKGGPSGRPPGEATFVDISKSKPLALAYEKEIVSYAFYNGTVYFSTECLYAPEAFRGSVRQLVRKMQQLDPRALHSIILLRQTLYVPTERGPPAVTPCKVCKLGTNKPICKACHLVGTLCQGKASILKALHNK